MWQLSCHTLFKVKCGIWCIKKIRVFIQFRYINGEHWLCCILKINDVLVIAITQYKFQISLCAHKSKQQSHRIIRHSLFELLTTRLNILFRYTCTKECLFCNLHLFPSISKLKVKKILCRTKRHLSVLSPALTIKTKVIGSCCVFKFRTIFLCENLRFSNVRIILWL